MTGRPMPAGFEVGVMLLAAGASRRMGTQKMLLPWGATSVIGHMVRQWQELGARQIAVVHAEGDAQILRELERLAFPAANRIPNPLPERGMFSSIQCAADWPGWDPTLTHWAIVLGDQPHLRSSTLQGLLTFAAANRRKTSQPARGGHPRHPVLLPEVIFHQLPHTTAGTLKEFLQTMPDAIALCEMDDQGLDIDIDNPDDYQRALESCFPHA